MPTLLTKQLVKIPCQADDFRYVKTFFDKHTVDGPAFSSLIMGPRRDGLTYPENHSDYYINRGLHGIQYPAGPSSSGPALAQNRANFSGRGAVADTNGNKPFRDYTEADCDRVANYYFAREDARFHTSDFTEVYDGTGFYYDENPAMWIYFHRKMGLGMKARGHIWGGEYGGPFSLDFKVDEGGADYVNALASPLAAFTFMQSNPYFMHEMWKYGCHATVLMYFAGKADFRYRNLQYEMQLAVAKLAFEYINMGRTGNDRALLIAYHENIVNEFTPVGQAVKKRMDIAGGGEMVWFGNFTIDLNEMFWFSFRGAITTDITWDFTDPQMHGTSQSTLFPDETNNDGVVTRRFDALGTGNNPARTQARGWYNVERTSQRGANGGPYPGDVDGFGDAIPHGFNMAGELTRHVGRRNYKYPALTTAGNLYTPGAGYSFAKAGYLQNLPIVIGDRNESTGNGWLAWIDHGTQFGRNVTVNHDGVSIPIFCYPGQPQFLKYTSTL